MIVFVSKVFMSLKEWAATVEWFESSSGEFVRGALPAIHLEPVVTFSAPKLWPWRLCCCLFRHTHTHIHTHSHIHIHTSLDAATKEPCACQETPHDSAFRPLPATLSCEIVNNGGKQIVHSCCQNFLASGLLKKHNSVWDLRLSAEMTSEKRVSYKEHYFLLRSQWIRRVLGWSGCWSAWRTPNPFSAPLMRLQIQVSFPDLEIWLAVFLWSCLQSLASLPPCHPIPSTPGSVSQAATVATHGSTTTRLCPVIPNRSVLPLQVPRGSSRHVVLTPRAVVAWRRIPVGASTGYWDNCTIATCPGRDCHWRQIPTLHLTMKYWWATFIPFNPVKIYLGCVKFEIFFKIEVKQSFQQFKGLRLFPCCFFQHPSNLQITLVLECKIQLSCRINIIG